MRWYEFVLGRYSPRTMYKDDKQPAAYYPPINSIVSSSQPPPGISSPPDRQTTADLGLILYIPTHVVASHLTAVIILLLPPRLPPYGINKGGPCCTGTGHITIQTSSQPPPWRYMYLISADRESASSRFNSKNRTPPLLHQTSATR